MKQERTQKYLERTLAATAVLAVIAMPFFGPSLESFGKRVRGEKNIKFEQEGKRINVTFEENDYRLSNRKVLVEVEGAQGTAVYSGYRTQKINDKNLSALRLEEVGLKGICDFDTPYTSFTTSYTSFTNYVHRAMNLAKEEKLERE